MLPQMNYKRCFNQFIFIVFLLEQLEEGQHFTFLYCYKHGQTVWMGTEWKKILYLYWIKRKTEKNKEKTLNLSLWNHSDSLINSGSSFSSHRYY